MQTETLAAILDGPGARQMGCVLSRTLKTFSTVSGIALEEDA